MDVVSKLSAGWLKLYWISLVLAFLTLRFTIFVESESRFGLGQAYMLFAWLPAIVLNFIVGRRLTDYLMEKHQLAWSQITHVPGFGPGGVNSFRTLRFLYSLDNLGDPIVENYKAEYRSVIR